jgi:hypothetical protein
MSIATATLPTVHSVTSIPPANFICPSCSFSGKEISLAEKLVHRAGTLIQTFEIYNTLEISSVDTSILIIETEQGELIYSKGDLSFLMPKSKAAKDIFVENLKPVLREGYKNNQQAVWNFKLKDEPAQFVTKCGRQAMFFPIFMRGQRFTATIFSPAELTA